MTVTEKLKKILEDSGWSQENLAQMLGVPHMTLNRWLRGRSKPREAAIEKIDAMYVGIVGTTVVDVVALEGLKLEVLEQKMSACDMVGNAGVLDKFTIYSTYHTNNIEGSTMTLDDVQDVLDDDDKVLINKTAREQMETRNHRSALYFLLSELMEKGEKFKWTLDLILGIHLRLLNSVISNAGRLRDHGVIVLGSNVEFAEPEEVPGMMNELVKELNRDSKDDIIRRMAQLHATFEQIHPFSDGNGRVGRLIMVTQALHENCVPPLILKERKKNYYMCLKTAQNEGDYLPLERFIAESMLISEDVLINQKD